MSGPSLQKVLNNAFKVVGKVVGFQCTHFRPDNYVNPTQDRNLIGFITASITPDDSFGQFGLDELAKYKVYASSAALQLGDILYSQETANTYTIIAKEELRPCTAVLTNDVLDVLRPALTTGDRKTTLELVCENLPCALKITGSSQSAGALQGMNSTMSTSNSEIEVWTWLQPGTVKLNDVLFYNGNKFLVVFAQSTQTGTILRARATKSGT